MTTFSRVDMRRLRHANEAEAHELAHDAWIDALEKVCGRTRLRTRIEQPEHSTVEHLDRVAFRRAREERIAAREALVRHLTIGSGDVAAERRVEIGEGERHGAHSFLR